MKKFYFLFFAFFFVIGLNAQGLTVTRNGAVVTFTFDDSENTDWDVNPANGFNLYLFVDAADGPNTVAVELNGAFPGNDYPLDNGDIYVLSVDMANFFNTGDTINDIRLIYTDDEGNQNPMGFGNSFSAANKGGFTAFTMPNLGLGEIEQNELSVKAINNQIYFSEAGKYDIQVFDLSGKQVAAQSGVQISAGQVHSLGLSNAGVYIVQVRSDAGIQNIKTIVQ